VGNYRFRRHHGDPTKSIVICVDYADHLAKTIVNARHFSETLIVTAPHDAATREYPNTYVTDAFYRNGAHFNKGAAMEEAFNVIGRAGWICTWDADILLPDDLQLPELDPWTLYSAPRRMDDGAISREWGFPGYFHIFNAIAHAPPWYDVTFKHAGGGDGYFASRFAKREYLPIEVRHFGPRDTNWCGRDNPVMAEMIAGRDADGAAVWNERVNDRIGSPGSDFRL